LPWGWALESVCGLACLLFLEDLWAWGSACLLLQDLRAAWDEVLLLLLLLLLDRLALAAPLEVVELEKVQMLLVSQDLLSAQESSVP